LKFTCKDCRLLQLVDGCSELCTQLRSLSHLNSSQQRSECFYKQCRVGSERAQ